MQKSRLAACPACARRGLLSMELVLSLPVVALLLLGLLEFGCLTSGYAAIVRASRTGAQLAAETDHSGIEVAAAVRQSLGGSLGREADVCCEPAVPPASRSLCRVRVPMSACAPNLLRPVGFNLQGRFIECTTRTPVAATASELPR